MYRNNAFALLGALLLAACGGRGPVDGEPQYDTGSQAGSGSAAQTDGGQQEQDAGGEPTGSDAQADAAPEQQPESTECDFHGPYRIVVTLTAGDASCSPGAEFEDVSLATRDVDTCTGVFCVDGTNCVDLECDRGNPVPECGATRENGACTYEWTLIVGN